MYRLRYFLMEVWLLVSCAVGFFKCFSRWKDPDMNSYTAGLYSRGALKIARLDVEFENLEDLEKHQPCIYVANHQDMFDMATYGKHLPKKTVGIGKKELLWVPFFGAFFYAAGNVMIDRQNRVSAVSRLSQVVETIKRKGHSIFIFPEGTRNRSQAEFLPFKKGAFYMAIDAQVPVIALVSGKLDLKLRARKLKIRVLPPFDTRGYTRDQVDELAEKVRGRMLEAFRSLSAET
jgi:1-acyl-sn-glycerol-3-phosphate acyltransferase